MQTRAPGEPLRLEEWQSITLDVATLTLGEASKAEQASGLSLDKLARGASLRLLALYVHGLRNYDVPPTWSELSNLTVTDVSRSK